MSKVNILKSKFVLSTALVLASVATLFSGSMAGAVGFASNINTADLHNLANQQRASAGLGSLALNSQLSSAASAKAYHMFANNYWAHVAPDGTSPWYFIANSGYSYVTAGENLAKDFSTSSGVITGWMNSPTHRANVLGSSYTEVGYAVVNGNLLGSDTTLVVAMYGNPTVVEPVVVTPAPEATPTPVVEAAPAPVTSSALGTTQTQTVTSTETAPVTTTQTTTEAPAPTAETKVTTPISTKTKGQTKTSSKKSIKVAVAEISTTASPLASFIEFLRKGLETVTDSISSLALAIGTSSATTKSEVATTSSW